MDVCTWKVYEPAGVAGTAAELRIHVAGFSVSLSLCEQMSTHIRMKEDNELKLVV